MRFPTNLWIPWAFFLLVLLMVVPLVLVRSAWPRRWKMTLGLSASLVVLASGTGLLVATSAPAPPSPVPPTLVNGPAPVPASLSLAFAQDLSPSGSDGNLDTTVVTLNARTGTLRWQQSFGAAPMWVAADAHALYLMTYMTTNPTVIALRASDGKPLWHTRLNTVSPDESIPPVLADGMVYAGEFWSYDRGVIYALRATDGALAWSRATNGSYLTAGAGLVMVGSDLGITAYRGSTGAPVWRWSPPPDLLDAPDPFFAGGVVYAIAGQQILALQASDGTVLWSHPLSEPLGYPWLGIGASSLYFYQRDVEQSGHPDYFYSLDAQTGRLRWKYRMGINVPTGVSEARDLVYVASPSALDALRVSDGQRVWQQSSINFGAPLVVNDVLFVASFGYIPDQQPTCPPVCEGQGVNALNATTGSLYWRTAGQLIGPETPLVVSAASPGG